MTEAEWVAATDPVGLLLFLRGPKSIRIERQGIFERVVEVNAPGLTSARKLRLAACACCRRVGHLLTDEAYRTLIDVNELFAEGAVGAAELTQAWQVAHDIPFRPLRDLYEKPTTAVLGLREWLDVERLRGIDDAVRSELSESYVVPERLVQCNLIRDIVGSTLFRPVVLASQWRSETALALAAGIYEERAFDRLPILADALEEAGCDNPDILAHCRGDGPHVRGCWVVDLILGKS